MPSRRSFLKVLGAASGSLASMGAAAGESEQAQPAVAANAQSLQVALMQAAAAGNDQQQNLTIAERYCRQAAEQGADILLMPEMWNIGYQGFGQFDKPTITKWQKQSIATDSPWVNRFRELAAELGIQLRKGALTPNFAHGIFTCLPSALQGRPSMLEPVGKDWLCLLTRSPCKSKRRSPIFVVLAMGPVAPVPNCLVWPLPRVLILQR